MKKLILCLAIMLGSFIVKGQSYSSSEWTLYDVTSVTKGSLYNGECYLGATNNNPSQTIIGIKRTAIMHISKESTFGCSIKNTVYEGNGVTYETRKDLTGDLILVSKKTIDGVLLINFINVTQQEVTVYGVKERKK